MPSYKGSSRTSTSQPTMTYRTKPRSMPVADPIDLSVSANDAPHYMLGSGPNCTWQSTYGRNFGPYSDASNPGLAINTTCIPQQHTMSPWTANAHMSAMPYSHMGPQDEFRDMLPLSTSLASGSTASSAMYSAYSYDSSHYMQDHSYNDISQVTRDYTSGSYPMQTMSSRGSPYQQPSPPLSNSSSDDDLLAGLVETDIMMPFDFNLDVPYMESYGPATYPTPPASQYRLDEIDMLLWSCTDPCLHSDTRATRPAQRPLKSASERRPSQYEQDPKQDSYRTRTTSDAAPARKHKLYSAPPSKDGLYHCPFLKDYQCGHKPTKQKCTYE